MKLDTLFAVIESVLETDSRLDYPLCIGGVRACPPENCGGAAGYERFLASLTDENHDEQAATAR